MPTKKIELIEAIAIARGASEPTNKDVFWLDKSSEGGFYDRLKSYNYDTGKWELISRSSIELLTDLKTVDGEGSGLDSDTLRGYTPEELITSGGSGLPPLSTGKIIVGQGDSIGEAKTLGGIATIDANGSMAYVTNSISHTGLTDVGTNTHAQIDSHIGDSAIHLSTAQSTKLAGIEAGATTDQTDAEIETAYNNQVPAVTQAEAEAGTVTTVKRWTPERVKQAIDALSGGGTDVNAVHVNVASEISGITAKATPTTNDIILIEDAADSNNKKKITIGDLPASTADTIYTADGTLSGDRTVDTDGNKLTIDGSGVGSNQKIFVINKPSGEALSIDEDGDFLVSGSIRNSSFFGVEANQNGYWYHGTIRSVIIGKTNTTTRTQFNQNGTLFFNNSNSEIHRVGLAGGGSGQYLTFFKTGFGTGQRFLLGGTALISTEDISLQGNTVIQGGDTLVTSSALRIYDGDTTPSVLWAFRNNGDIVQGKNAVIDTNGKTLRFDSSASYVVDPFKFQTYPFGGTGTNPYLKIKAYGEVEIRSSLNDIFRLKDGGGGDKFKVNSTQTSIYGNLLVTTTYFKMQSSTQALKFTNTSTGNLIHEIQTDGGGAPVKTKFNIIGGTSQFIVGANAVIGSEKISLQGHTIVKGADTLSGNSALQIYNGDTTPALLWDFRNNGDLIHKNGIINIDTVSNANYDRIDLFNRLYIGELSGTTLLIEPRGSASRIRLQGNLDLQGVVQLGNGYGLETESSSMGNLKKINTDFFGFTNYNDSIEIAGLKDSILTQYFWNKALKIGTNHMTGITSGKILDVDGDTLINGTLDMNNNRITNTVVNPSVQETASTATFTVNADEQTDGVLTAMAAATTIAAPTGTPVQSQSLVFRFKDDGTARAITWNAIFRAIGITLPTTTTASKLLYVGCKYNSTDTKWDVVSVQEEA